MNSKKTIVLGASTNPSRYSYMAVNRLVEKGHNVVPVGIKKGSIAGLDIQSADEEQQDIDTITLYLGPQNQSQYYNYLLAINPKRVIFNPGTANPELEDKLRENGIAVVEACTLVMLSNNLY
ncbi:MAG: CoA-binding protein [Vicingaceae bacterium]